MKTITAFMLGMFLSLGAGATYFGMTGDGAGIEAQAKPTKKDVNGPSRWQLISRDHCVACDFEFCNCG